MAKEMHGIPEKKIYYSIGRPMEYDGWFTFPGATLGERSNLRVFTRMLVESVPIGAKLDVYLTNRYEEVALGAGYYELIAAGLIEREPPDRLASGLMARINGCLPQDWQWKQEIRHLFFWEHAMMSQPQALALAGRIREEAPSLKRVLMHPAAGLFQPSTTYKWDAYVCEISEKPWDPKQSAYIQSEERWERYKQGDRHAYPVKGKQGLAGA